MKQQVSAPVMAAIVVVLVIIIAGIGWKMMQPKEDLAGARGNAMIDQMKQKFPNMQPPAGVNTTPVPPATPGKH